MKSIDIMYVGEYRIREDGVILNRHGARLKQFSKKTVSMGYLYVSLVLDGVCKQRSVHSLVYECFHGELPEGMVIDHDDGDPTNNHSTNLVARTHKDNCRKGVNVKLDVDKVREIKSKMLAGVRNSELASEYGVSQQTICDIKKGRRWSDIH